MSELKEILVIGGTGAQGVPVVKALAESNRYRVRVLTRDTTSARAQALAALPNVALVQGQQDSQADLRAAFAPADDDGGGAPVHGAWVNLDGFTLGEQREVFYGIRAYELARAAGVRHYVWASTDYALKQARWDAAYHWGHNDAKGRVGDFVLAQGQQGMRSSLLTTGPYMDMLFDGMFVPEQEEGGGVVWKNPAKDGKIPLIALADVGAYALWLFDHPDRAAGLDLRVATDVVSFDDIVKTFTRVTGRPARHEFVPLDVYLPRAEPYPDAPANWAADPSAPRDKEQQSWRENFGAWWRFWGEGRVEPRDFGLLDEIHPKRIKSLEEWMRAVGYDGKPRSVLKAVEDLKRRTEGN